MFCSYHLISNCINVSSTKCPLENWIAFAQMSLSGSSVEYFENAISVEDLDTWYGVRPQPRNLIS